MATISDNALTKVSTEAAETFVDAYYAALKASRRTISHFYCPQTSLPDGKVVPSIVWNGNLVGDASTLQEMFQQNMPSTQYDVQSVDCHVLNANYNGMNKQTRSNRDVEKHISILVQVSGSVKLGDTGHTGSMRAFSETFVLVPNVERSSGRGVMAGRRSFLVQSQNFRYVV